MNPTSTSPKTIAPTTTPTVSPILLPFFGATAGDKFVKKIYDPLNRLYYIKS